MRIFHLATRSDWAAAQQTGRYTTSTRGRSLAEEGFIHASRGDQWQGVRARFYADVEEPLVLLVIDTDRLSAPVVEETPPGGDETFPHIYGALDIDAVVSVIELDGAGEAPPATGPALETSAQETPPATEPSATEPSATEPSPSFSRLFFTEMGINLALGAVLLACVGGGTVTGRAVGGDPGSLIGLAVGLVVGVLVVARLYRRHREVSRPPRPDG